MDQQTRMTAERIGTEYHVRIYGKLVAVFITLDAFLSGVRLLSLADPTNDGPEVDIINRESQIKAEEFFGIV